MSVEGVDGDLKVEFASCAHDGDDVIEGAGTHQTAIGLQQRPQWEDPYVIEAQSCNCFEVASCRIDIEVKPAVEPSLRRCVIDANPHRLRPNLKVATWKGRMDRPIVSSARSAVMTDGPTWACGLPSRGSSSRSDSTADVAPKPTVIVV